ncbi:type II secretion system protein N [Nitrosococcus wardiae]|uniref:Pilus assembly protein PilZ n=1 Tax=Nitrosococcus wardiae TaxID=1814290 RepID=A0A4V1AVL3_9GAMM|nr:type II secretion system protein N [Nitrosococcus wardiae]QBQ53535.1 pilus assembly protein PilZ [Nitrosococcus wardiae]
MHLAEPNHKALAILLVSLCLVVLGVIALEVRYPPRFGQAGNGANSSTPSSNLIPERKPTGDVALLPFDHYEETVARPLFRPSRRPPEPEESESEAQQAAEQSQQPQVPAKELFALNGVVVTEKKTVALLQDIKNNKNLRVREGEKLEGWQIVQIFPDKVLLKNNGHSEALELIRDFEPMAQKLLQRKRAVRRNRQKRRR